MWAEITDAEFVERAEQIGMGRAARELVAEMLRRHDRYIFFVGLATAGKSDHRRLFSSRALDQRKKETKCAD